MTTASLTTEIQDEIDFQELPEMLATLNGYIFIETIDNEVVIIIHLPGDVELSQYVTTFIEARMYLAALSDMVNILSHKEIYHEVHTVIANEMALKD